MKITALSSWPAAYSQLRIFNLYLSLFVSTYQRIFFEFALERELFNTSLECMSSFLFSLKFIHSTLPNHRAYLSQVVL